MKSNFTRVGNSKTHLPISHKRTKQLISGKYFAFRCSLLARQKIILQKLATSY